MKHLLFILVLLSLHPATAQLDCFFLEENYSGKCESHYPDGKIKISAELLNGKRHGQLILNYPDGIKRAEANFEGDSLVRCNSFKYYPEKQVQWEIIEFPDRIETILYDQKGIIAQTGTLNKDFKPIGDWVRYEHGTAIQRFTADPNSAELEPTLIKPPKPVRIPELRVAPPK